MKEKCKECGSKKVKKEGKPEFHWATFAVNGVQPIEIQKLICQDCDKIFGKIVIEKHLQGDMLMEISK